MGKDEKAHGIKKIIRLYKKLKKVSFVEDHFEKLVYFRHLHEEFFFPKKILQ